MKAYTLPGGGTGLNQITQQINVIEVLDLESEPHERLNIRRR